MIGDEIFFFEKNQCRRGIRGLLAAFWLKGGKRGGRALSGEIFRVLTSDDDFPHFVPPTAEGERGEKLANQPRNSPPPTPPAYILIKD